ncbi:DUF6478 family protein [Frigidibacter sp. RF13]|uniref:DUF6478 family protein n=1 Tax=Frigidibacter sp. RF13 TaxID=2997340 RepID=UPI00226D9169|nr:DUF6478 family protein [Frigidibacter sp. RF13]MCY1126698.1 DUF6478 family protein [Frigidibacter sp. RF13]
MKRTGAARMAIGRLDRWRLKRELARWRRWAGAAGGMEAAELMELRASAKSLGRAAGQLARRAESEMVRHLGVGAGPVHAPPMSDVAWRPEAWSTATRISESGPQGRKIGEELTLYHDCPLGLLSLRQRPNGSEDRAPFGLVLTVYDFQGSYLSLSLQVPPDRFALTGSQHVIAVDLTLRSEAPQSFLARLNITHAGTTAQTTAGLNRQGDRALAEFDLAALHLNDKRIERIWIDLFVERPSMNRIAIADFVVSRRPRAPI